MTALLRGGGRLARLLTPYSPRQTRFISSKPLVLVLGDKESGVVKAAPTSDLPVELHIAGTAEEALSHPRGKDAEAVLWMFNFKRGEIEKLYPELEKLRWIHSFSTGVDPIIPFIKENLTQGRGADVTVTNGRGAFSSSLAEWVMTSVLYFNKQIQRCQRNRAERKYDRFTMNVAAKKTIGFVGFGHIAQLSAKLAKEGFGMRVLAARREVDKGDEYGGLPEKTFHTDNVKEMLPECDYVVSVLPGTPKTQDFFNKEIFAAMKKGAVFISIGRGSVVDEDALVDVLKSGHLAGAALDVFKVEPLPESSPLWDCENLLLTAHNADITEDYFELGWSVWRKNLAVYLAGGSDWKTPINKEEGY